MSTKQGAQLTIRVVLISLISFVAGEITLRVYNYFNPSYIFYSDSYNRFRGKPFTDDWDFKLNSKGFKDVEFTPKGESVYRIIAIGDSFAFGVVPYKHNYLTLLESQLNQRNGQVEVLNLGIPGMGAKDYLSLFVREGLELNPDMVLLSFFVGNDFMESDRKRKLYSYSYAASLLYYIARLQPKYEGRVIHGRADYCDDCPSVDQETYLKIAKDRSFIYVRSDKYFAKLLDNALFHLGQIRDICKKKGIELVVVIIPDEVQIDHALQTEIKNASSPQLTANDWNITLPNEMLANRLNSLNINYLDLYPYFASESKQRQLYRPSDTHWNIAGNQLAANVIKNYLGQHLRQRRLRRVVY